MRSVSRNLICSVELFGQSSFKLRLILPRLISLKERCIASNGDGVNVDALLGGPRGRNCLVLNNN